MQVVDNYMGPPPKDNAVNYCLVISDEEDYNICVPALKQGACISLPSLLF
jgi:hypothetical protein